MTENHAFKKRIRLQAQINDESYTVTKEKLENFQVEPQIENIFSDKDTELFKKLLFPGYLNKGNAHKQVSDGTLLFTGVIGSGRRVTLSAAIKKLTANQDRIVFLNSTGYPSLEYTQLDNTVYLEVTSKNTPQFLIKQTLRMSPDAIVIDEIRTEETIYSLLRAGNAGHLTMATFYGDDLKRLIESSEIRNELIAMRGIVQHKNIYVKDAGKMTLTAVVPLNAVTVETIKEGTQQDLEHELEVQGIETVRSKTRKLIERGILTVPPKPPVDLGDETSFI